MNVCTLAYNKGFECGRIKELAIVYPNLAVHLMNIREHIQDLLIPFQSGYYYVPAMHGSFSIKSVLPALFPDDPELNYHNLDSRVQNGGDAMTVFPRIKDMPPEEQQATRQALLAYCCLDTLAMVKVWEKLIEISNNKSNKYMMEDILKELKENPMFMLSLGSKELFHSNFLEFIWNNNRQMFIDVINKMTNLDVLNGDPENYTFSREKENFDISIFHKEKNKIVYDLIIENKVKSIPRKEQLEDYYKKIKDPKEMPTLLLLSLVEKFPDKTIIEKAGNWIICNYESLSDAIKRALNNHNDISHIQYIRDYTSFIDNMHDLQSIILDDFGQSVYYNQEELNKLKEIRLHDLYIKLRNSYFMDLLSKELSKVSSQQTQIQVMPFRIKGNKIFTYKDIRGFSNDGCVHVFLENTIQRGTGMIAAYIYKKNNTNDYIYEVVIQGDQYRHGINSNSYKSVSELWEKVEEDGFMFRKNAGKNKYNKYGNEYVYRYEKIENPREKNNVKDLLDRMHQDILCVISRLQQERF